MRVAFAVLLGGAAAVGTFAQTTDQVATSAVRPATPTAAAAPAPVVVPPHIQEVRKALTGMLVAIDPETGTLRAPDADEVATLTGGAAQARFAEPPQIALPNGGAVVYTSAATMDLLTVQRQADGSLRYVCTHGIDANDPTGAARHKALGTGEVIK